MTFHISRRASRWLAASALALPLFSAQADEALARKNGCTACHAMSSKVMGPAFREIAAKYAGQADATQALAASIRAGGSGRWGSLPMPPQAQLSEANVTKLAAWLAAGAK